MTKINFKELVARADDAKKVNPRDLSSDQDLTVGLMNLIAVEEMLGDCEMRTVIRDMRANLMARVVDKSGADGDVRWRMSERLLAESMRAMNDDEFDKSYELYALFWGINMGLVDLNTVNEHFGVDLSV